MDTANSGGREGARVATSFGRYTVLASWAKGGMAEVFLALQPGMKGFDKLMALKLLLPELVQDKEFRDMFFAEARTAALLTHPNIAHTYDVGESEGRVYMAMEFVNGETLARVLRTVQKEPGARLDQALALTIARDIAKALHYAHTMTNLESKPLQLVHRDVSPTNLMLSHDGAVKLIDFGVAKVATADKVTNAGVVKGKFAYLSPEQARGEKLDGRSDVFSLGCVLWEMLTGVRAFQGQNEFELVNAVTSQQVPPPSSAGALCDPELDLIVGLAVALDREDRYASAKELADELDAYLRTNFPGFDAEAETKALMKSHFSRRAAKVRDLIASRLTRPPVSGVKPEDWDLEDLSEGGFGLNSKVSVRKTLSALPGLEALTAVAMPPPREDGIKRWIAVALIIVLLFGLVAWWLGTAASTREVQVTSNPVGADIFVAGEMKGRTPSTVVLPLDEEVKLVLALRGYGEEVAVLESGDESPNVSRTLLPAEVYGTVFLDTIPLGARISVDGKRLDETTPVELNGLWVGEPHEVTVELDGFAPEKRTISFLASDEVELAIPLQPTPETVRNVDAVAVAKEELLHMAKEDAGDLLSESRPTEEDVGEALGATDDSIEEKNGAPSTDATAEPVPVAADVSVAEAYPVDTVDQDAAGPVPTPEGDRKTERRRRRAQRRAADAAPTTAVAPVQPAKDLPPLKVTIRSPGIDGSIDAAALREALKALQPATLKCYQDEYKSSPFDGFLTLDFTIVGGSNKVSSATAEGDASEGLKNCVAKAIKRGSFPNAPGKDVKVQVKVKFDAH